MKVSNIKLGQLVRIKYKRFGFLDINYKVGFVVKIEHLVNDFNYVTVNKKYDSMWAFGNKTFTFDNKNKNEIEILEDVE